nr:CapA family protein [Bacillus sp. JCM 19034]
MKWIQTAVILLLILSGCQQATEPPVEEEQDPEPEETAVEQEHEEEPIPPPVEEETTITLGAIGDVLLHERLYETAEVEDGYDFMRMLEPVNHLLEEPDFMMANQESLPGGEELGLSTYPTFNSPQEIARDLQLAGVDMVSVANNHTLDRGLQLVYNSIDYYDEIGLHYVGAYRDQDDRERMRIIDVDGISSVF